MFSVVSESGIWFVARVKPQRELWAAQNIIRQGFRCYLPRFIEPDGKRSFLFPGYMFVATDGRWRFMCGTFGMIGPIMVGNEPATMRHQDVLALKAREDAQGIVRLPDAPRYRIGDKVRVISGALSGWIGIYQGSTRNERERILLDFLGNRTPVLIAREHLAAA